MDDWGFEQLRAWLECRVELPVGPLLCVIDGPTRGRAWAATAARGELRQLAAQAGVRRRVAPHQLRHAHAVELAREGVAVNIIQRQLGHTDLGTTSTYLQGIDPSEIIDAVRSRRQPTVSVNSSQPLGKPSRYSFGSDEPGSGSVYLAAGEATEQKRDGGAAGCSSSIDPTLCGGAKGSAPLRREKRPRCRGAHDRSRGKGASRRAAGNDSAWADAGRGCCVRPQ